MFQVDLGFVENVTCLGLTQDACHAEEYKEAKSCHIHVVIIGRKTRTKIFNTGFSYSQLRRR